MFISVAVPTSVCASQMEVSTFNLLRVGMSESEVLSRAGFPDLDTSVGVEGVENETFIRDPNGNDIVVGVSHATIVAAIKEFHYIPGFSEH